MSNFHDDPCKGCNLNCCTKMGMFLSEEECLRHFQPYSDRLIIKRPNKHFLVFPKAGHVCPHLENGKCRIHDERPIDCRVYPYVLRYVIETKKKVKIVYHTRSECPQKNKLYQLITDSDARNLLVAFGKKLYGENKSISVHRESGIVSQLQNRIEAAFFKRLNRMKKDNRKH